MNEGVRPDALPVKPPNGGTPLPNLIRITFTAPASAARVPAGLSLTVTGHAVAARGNVTAIGAAFNGASVPATKSAPATSVAWQAAVTPVTGTNALEVSADGTLDGEGVATLNFTGVTDTPVLSCVSPVPTAPNRVTTTSTSFALAIHVQTLGSPVRATEYQLGAAVGGSQWTGLAGPNTAGNWTGTIALPSSMAPKGGTTYPLRVRATTVQGLTGVIDLSVLATDATAPQIITFDVPAELVAGTTPTVNLQITDAVAGAVQSGLAAVTVALDGQPPVNAAQVPGTTTGWTAQLPVISHAKHTVTVLATDVQGNPSTQQRSATVALTSWTRLEPVPRDPTLIEGLQARIADPLWLLTRQAAFGEFAGEDTASPVAVRLRARAATLTRLRAAGATGSGALLPADAGPLETLCQTEPVADGDPGALFIAQAGLHYLRLLQAAPGVGDLTVYRQGLLAAYPFPAPATPQPGGRPPAQADDPSLLPYAGRVPDAVALHAALSAALQPPGTGTMPTSPPLGAADPAAVTQAAHAWIAWYEAVAGQAGVAGETWTPGRLEYAFAVAAPGPGAETILGTEEFSQGTLDWFDFDLLGSSLQPPPAGTSLGAVSGDLPGGESAIQFAGLPTPVSFRGMPNRRWWDFEDAAIDFGAVSAPAESVTTSLIVEFALRYGNDHFIIPVPLSLGSVCRVDSLVVLNTFGEVLRIRPVSEVDGAAGPFRLFEHAPAAPAGGAAVRDPLFVLFPTLDQVITGPTLEEVDFARDEAAELVWAIELTATDADGAPHDRSADALAHFTPLPPTPNDDAALPTRRYVPRTDVEQNWFPFLLIGGTASMGLADVPPLDGSAAPLPWGRILAPYLPAGGGGAMLGGQARGIALPQEEVTSAGVQVVRAWRYARWIDGTQLSWIGRHVRPGQGPAASGLTFDLAR